MALIWGGDVFTVTGGSPPARLFNSGMFSRRMFNPTSTFEVRLFNDGMFNRQMFNPTSSLETKLFNTGGLFNKRMFNPTTHNTSSRFDGLIGRSPLLEGLIR